MSDLFCPAEACKVVKFNDEAWCLVLGLGFRV